MGISRFLWEPTQPILRKRGFERLTFIETRIPPGRLIRFCCCPLSMEARNALSEVWAYWMAGE
jgi:hypothetical protein